MHVSCDSCSVGVIRGDKWCVEVTGAGLWCLLLVPSGPGGVADPDGAVEVWGALCSIVLSSPPPPSTPPQPPAPTHPPLADTLPAKLFGLALVTGMHVQSQVTLFPRVSLL